MDIDKLIKVATLEKNGASKEAYRAIKAELLLNSSSKNPKKEGKNLAVLDFMTDSGEQILTPINELEYSVIKKLVKEREEQVSMYDANSRKDLADMYREQLQYLKELLPKEASAECIEETIVSLYPNGFDKKEMKKVIKEVKDIHPISDGKLISELIKKHING